MRERNARAQRIRSTTVLCVRKDNKIVMVGDGQVTVGEHVMKHSAKKTRRMFDDKVLAGFAGGTADAFTLFEQMTALERIDPSHAFYLGYEMAKDACSLLSHYLFKSCILCR